MSDAAHKQKMEERARECANGLRGTAKSLTDVASTTEINDSIFCDELDLCVFECAVCGWWCDESECNGDNVCDDCMADEANDGGGDGDDD